LKSRVVWPGFEHGPPYTYIRIHIRIFKRNSINILRPKMSIVTTFKFVITLASVFIGLFICVSWHLVDTYGTPFS
jgi:hypothetical protein